jgi:HlyD family secretion protein
METRPPRKKWSLLKVIEISLSVTLIILLAMFLLQSRRNRESQVEVPLRDITISEVKLGPLNDYLPVEGTVQPMTTVYLDAVEGGRVEKIYVEVGSIVKEGDSILLLGNTNLLMDIMWREAELFQQSNNLRNTRLSMEQFKLQLDQQLSELENQLQQTKRLYDRYKELDKDSLISKQDFETARDQYEYLTKRKELMTQSQKSELAFRRGQVDALEQSLERMQANLDVVKQRQENLTIKAPIMGQITSLNAEIGQSKSPGQRLGQIDVLSGFKATAFINEDRLGQVDVNKPGVFDFAGQTFNLIVKKIYPEVKDGKFEVELEFRGERPKGIRRGQTLHVRLELGQISKAILLAKGDFLKSTGGDWVYKVDPEKNVATRKPIKLGRQDAQVIEIIRGLKPGDRVITSSYDSFANKEQLLLKEK